MQLLFAEVKKYKKTLAGALVLATVNQVFSLLDPQIFRIIIDNYATRVTELTRQEFLTGVLLMLLAYMGVAFISRTAKAFQDYYTNVMTQRVGTNLYAQSVAHAFSLPFSVFEDERSGELLNKLQKARTDTQTLIQNLVNILFLSVIGIVFVLIYAATIHWLIGLVFFLMIPTLGFIIFFLSKKIKEAQAMIVKETAALSGSTTETLRNVELVKSLGLEGQEIGRLNSVNEKILDLELKKVQMVRKLDYIQGTLINALRSLVLFVILWLVFTQVVSIGEFLTLWIYTFFVFGPLSMIGQVTASYQEAKASLEQLEAVFKIKPEPVPADAVRIEHVESVAYEQVSLSYEEKGKAALDGISLNIKAGETVAFVGPSGSGKSTMVKLLAGLYTPTEGTIRINDTDMRKLDITSLRHKVGLVVQETQLFAGTLRENLLFVKPDATDERCLEVLKAAQAQSILDRGEGLDTVIGEGGIKLSGGEKQRLAIARALLRDPDLIVFDEATSSLDSITEKSITDTIKKIEETHPNMIKVLVAHRLSTIMHADRIYVFEKGKIVEMGRHDELVQRGGLYNALWREQIAANS
ncbi:MAG: ABC transporter ATP-binding protein [Candidatus Zambryskibacteria bacterium CG10_big_fil_rev_8_21_14_0_10_42_12]|uniref:ABC transporter ATP-binding protein n=1 Tax=Candidatus Zambryskibacteria bacterium CG10_big_fil_rev_8_21_14_0_10_42_12 TaxID=1975115 RepID=A0A2H0QVJ8_9BACT|nr:MAG: ABC transporter ATP-binding protein [Candidatus Zambryskibacteria bacterium CG10_big_fil_rev_8_21_14_0_10_42_12]